MSNPCINTGANAAARCPENDHCSCGRPRCGARRNYFCCAVGFLVLILALAVGVILGAVYYETILPVIASVIAFAAAIAVIVVALVIYYLCKRND